MELKNRKNIRLKNYDYGQYGYYYVTICTKDRVEHLCNVGSDALVAPKPSIFELTEIGEKVEQCILNIERLNENVRIDKYVIMPNHIHVIIIIENTDTIENCHKNFSFEVTERRGRRSLQGLVKDFKSVTTRYYKKKFNAEDSLWQSSFYEEIIRNQEHYRRVWEYIENNPVEWSEDELFNDEK